MKKNKRRIKTFKNWLLARDSASRISTKPTYLGFFSESFSNTPMNKHQIMDLFNSVTNSNTFKRFNKFSGSNIGISKFASDQENSELKIDLGSPISYPNILRFLIFLEPPTEKKPIDFKRVSIKPTEGSYDIREENWTYEKVITIRIPVSYTSDKKKIDDIIKNFIMLSLKGLIMEGTYQYRFLNWWIENIVFKGNEWESSSLIFENAFVEWMKNADLEDAKQAYVDFFGDSKNKRELLEKSKYYIDYDTRVKKVKEAIKEAGIKLDGTDRGSSLLSRFDS